VLDTAGVNDSIGKANVQLGYSVFQFAFAVFGAHFVEKIGRRKMMLAGFFGTSVVWVCMTAAAGTLANSLESGSVQAGDAVFSNKSAGNAVLAFIFIFGGVYSFNITPLQSLYPVEVISFEIRAKGMAFQSFFVNAAGLLNQFAWPVAIKQIEWKTYIIFVVWTASQGVLAYFFFPETRKRTVSFVIAVAMENWTFTNGLIARGTRQDLRDQEPRQVLRPDSPTCHHRGFQSGRYRQRDQGLGYSRGWVVSLCLLHINVWCVVDAI
jgi:MFS family permease